MIKTPKKSVCIFLFLILGYIVSAQSRNLEKVVQISVINQPVINVLKKIEQEIGITFSYRLELIDADKKVTIDSSDKTLEEILNILFEISNIKFFEVGNQIVIYKTATNRVIEKRISDTVIFKETVEMRDTIHTVLKDTIYITNTDTLIITKVDTVFQHLYDTIFKTVYEREIKTTVKKPRNTIEVFFKTAFYNNNHELPSDIEPQYDVKIQTSTKMSYYWSMGITTTKNFFNSSLSFGIGIKNRIDNNEFFYKKAIHHPDDSTIIVDSVYVFEKQLNKFRYLTIPIYNTWESQLSEKTAIGFGTGIWVNYLLSAEGICNKISEEYTLIDINDLPQKKLGVDLMIFGLITYSFAEKWSIWFSPIFEVQVTPDYGNNFIFYKNRTSFGVMLGARLNL